MKPLKLDPFKREPKSKCGNNKTHQKKKKKKKEKKREQEVMCEAYLHKVKKSKQAILS